MWREKGHNYQIGGEEKVYAAKRGKKKEKGENERCLVTQEFLGSTCRLPQDSLFLLAKKVGLFSRV